MKKWSDNAIKIYEKLYFNRDKYDKLVERNPIETHERVAKCISFNKNEEDKFLSILNKNLFRPNSPVLINAGGPKQFLSACYVLGLEDSMESIIDCWGTCAKIYASGAGAGLVLTNVRRKDGAITFGGRASGPLSYSKVLDVYSETVKAGNKARRAANMGMLKYNHPDIFDLVDCKLDRKTLKNFNLSIAVPDNFMEIITDRKLYGNMSSDFVDPKEGITGQFKVFDLWDKIIKNAWTIGDPGLFFVDTTNNFNPFVSELPIECTNPCGEVPLWPWSECVIGSINVSNMFDPNNNLDFFDWRTFDSVVDTATVFLDNCISKTLHPHPKFKNTMDNYRPIGLGIMGLADLFVKQRIGYDEEAAKDMFSKICKNLTKQAIRTSIGMCEDGKKPIKFPSKACKAAMEELIHFYDDMDETYKAFKRYGIRNCTWTSIAPTGSIALSADCSYSFEPLSAIVWEKELAETHNIMQFINPTFGKWLINHYGDNGVKIDPILEEIRENNGSVQGIKGVPENIQKVFKVAHDIDPYNKIDMQAAGQEFISLAISSTCNLPNETTEQEISDIFIYAWKAGLKGITVYRDGSHDWQPINFGQKEKEPTISIPKFGKDGLGEIRITQKEAVDAWIELYKMKEEKENFKEWIESEKIKHTIIDPNQTILGKPITLTDNLLKNYKLERPIRRKGETFEINTPHGRLYCTFNKDNEGRPLEVFLRLGKSGTLENLLLDTISRLVSKNLQNCVPYKDVSSILRGIKGDLFRFKFIEDASESVAAESIIDAVGLIMEVAFSEPIHNEGGLIVEDKNVAEGLVKLSKGYKFNDECPECHQYTLERTTGCRGGMCTNPNCLYTSCG